MSEFTNPEAPAADVSHKLQGAFLIATLSGFILALTGLLPGAEWVGFAGPLLTIIAFFVWGLRAGLADRADTRQRFADSCYFLGFLLTMLAMLIGFFPAGMFDQELTSQGILRHFSMALGATALGLVFRIVALQGGKSIAEDAAEVEAELRQYAEKVSREARAIGDDLEAMRAHLNRHETELLSFIGEQIPAALVGSVEALRSVANQIARELGDQTEQLRNTARLVGESLQAKSLELHEVQSKSAESQDRLDSSLRTTSEAVVGFGAAVTELQARSAASVREATASISQMASAFTNASRIAPQLESRLAEISDRVEVVGNGLQGIDDRLSSAREVSSEVVTGTKAFHSELKSEQDIALEALRNEIGTMSDQLRRNAQETVTHASEEARRQLDARLDEGNTQVRAMRDQAAGFEESLRQATGQFSAIVDRFAKDLASLRQEAEER